MTVKFLKWAQYGNVIYEKENETICQLVEPAKKTDKAEPLEIDSDAWDRQMNRAKLIIEAPRMFALLARLDAWADYMGGWEAPEWAEVKEILGRLREVS